MAIFNARRCASRNCQNRRGATVGFYRMSVIYFERIVDLGRHGVLTLTLDSDAYMPLPAQRYGRFVWYDAKGRRHDRSALCTRGVDAAALNAAADAQRLRLALAVESVRGRVDWVAAQVDDNFREAPYQAHALDGGQVLLVFGRIAGPAVVRVVDVAVDKVLAEERVDDLCGRLGCKRLVPNWPWDAVVHNAGGAWIGVWLGSRLELLCLREGRLERAAPDLLDDVDRFALTPGFCFIRRLNSAVVSVHAAADGWREVAQFKTPYRRNVVFPAGSLQADRCLLPYPGGIVQWIDGAGQSLRALRPFPAMARQDTVGTALSPEGSRALCIDAGYVVLDLERGRQAPVADVSEPAPRNVGNAFVPAVTYRGEMKAGDHAILRVHEGILSLERYDSLDWQPSLEPAAKGRRKAAPPADAYAALRRVAFALKPVKKGSGASQLYGRPHLAVAADWPHHEGRPMVLLCQIDLAAAAALAPPDPLPATGALVCFVAVDGAGKPAIDELSNPVAVAVRWVAALATLPLALPAGASEPPPARPLNVALDKAVWPQPDAIAVQAYGWAPQALETYRGFVDAALPRGPAAGHRLGGWPTIVQHNDLELDAAHEAGGDGLPARWRLLLQLASDNTFMWGTDSGTLYLMVHDDDLAQRDFSRVVALTQGA